jgi:Na+/melibiose symporter-like transporter
MAADTIDYQELKENKRSEGTYYGMLTLHINYLMLQQF